VTLDYPALAAQAQHAPEQLLGEYRPPVILDEVQYAPGLFRHLKIAVDADRTPGQFLVTGSQSFGLMAGVVESLAGRAALFTLPGLSLAEVTPAGVTPRGDVDTFLWRGSFPELTQRPELDRDLWLRSYLATYLERDVRQILQVGDLRDFDRFLRAVALRAGQLLSFSDLARDVGIAPNTAKRWLSVLEASHQVFLLEPWHRQHAKRLIKTPKVYMADTGLLCFLLGFRTLDDLTRHQAWGHVWENFVIGEIRKRLQITGHAPALWFWRTAHNDEVDLLIEVGAETFIAIECKAAEQVDNGALKGIRALAREIGTERIAESFVVCRSDVPYPLPGPPQAQALPIGALLPRLTPSASGRR
jgi:predicted AAA+ superfamily ATPase